MKEKKRKEVYMSIWGDDEEEQEKEAEAKEDKKEDKQEVAKADAAVDQEAKEAEDTADHKPSTSVASQNNPNPQTNESVPAPSSQPAAPLTGAEPEEPKPEPIEDNFPKPTDPGRSTDDSIWSTKNRAITGLSSAGRGGSARGGSIHAASANGNANGSSGHVNKGKTRSRRGKDHAQGSEGEDLVEGLKKIEITAPVDSPLPSANPSGTPNTAIISVPDVLSPKASTSTLTSTSIASETTKVGGSSESDFGFKGISWADDDDEDDGALDMQNVMAEWGMQVPAAVQEAEPSPAVEVPQEQQEEQPRQSKPSLLDRLGPVPPKPARSPSPTQPETAQPVELLPIQETLSTTAKIPTSTPSSSVEISQNHAGDHDTSAVPTNPRKSFSEAQQSPAKKPQAEGVYSPRKAKAERPRLALGDDRFKRMTGGLLGHAGRGGSRRAVGNGAEQSKPE